MIIYRRITKRGDCLGYRVRLHKPNGSGVNKIGPLPEVMEFISEWRREHPLQRKPQGRERTLQFKDEPTNHHVSTYVKRRDRIQANGCTLERRGAGVRCDRGAECAHYYNGRDGCIDLTAEKLWKGWIRV